MKQPTSEGDSPMTMCHPIVMMLVLPFHAELTSTMGPGSRKRRTSSTGKSRFRIGSGGGVGQPDERLEQARALARGAASGLTQPVETEQEAADLATGRNHLYPMAGADRRAHGMPQVLVDIAAVEPELPGE